MIIWVLGKGVKEALEAAAPGKALTPEFVCSLTYRQAVLLRDTLLAGDGTREAAGKANRTTERRTWWQDDPARKDGYQMLCAMLGIRSRQNRAAVFEYSMNHVLSETIRATATHERSPDGIVWCPTVQGGVWMARRNGNTYWTGNSEWHTPVHLMSFLDDARERNVLRTVGPVYQFRHARSQERLAAAATNGQ